MDEPYNHYKDLCWQLVQAWDDSVKCGRGTPFANSFISKAEWIVSNSRAHLNGYKLTH